MKRKTLANRKKKQRRTRIIKRYLRILVLILIVAAVIVGLVFLIKGLVNIFTKDEPIDTTPYYTSSETKTDDTGTPSISYEGYKKISFDNELDKTGSLILVNTSYGYSDIDESSLKSLYSQSTKNHFTLSSSSLKLLPEAYDALIKMTDDCYTAEKYENLQIISAYRTHSEQKEYYEKNVEDAEDKDYFEEAGYSDHHTGYCFDVKIFDSKNQISYSYAKDAQTEAKWIDDNYKNYGFIIRYPSERFEDTGKKEENHFRYVGIPHAVYIAENNLCLDGYVTRMSEHTLEKGALEITVGQDVYTVYYTPLSSGKTTDVYVPDGIEYSISGTNCGGFIVWYKN